jgi:hypothetical protein
VTVYPREREFLAQFIAVALVALGINRLLEQVGMFETIKLLSNRVGTRFGPGGFWPRRWAATSTLESRISPRSAASATRGSRLPP